MYEKNGKQITEAQALDAAKYKGQTLEEWLSTTGYVKVAGAEGKQNDSEEMTPPTGQNQTAAGDSSSADISLELQDFEPFLLTDEDLQGSEEDVYDKISAKLKAVGIETSEEAFGVDAIKLSSKLHSTQDGQGYDIPMSIERKLKGDDRSGLLEEFNGFISKYGDSKYADKVSDGKEDILKSYYEEAQPDDISLEQAKKDFVNRKISNWQRREKEAGNMGMGTYINVSLSEDDFDTPEEFKEYTTWKETGALDVNEEIIAAQRDEMAFQSKNRKSQKFIDNLSDEDREAIAANVSKELAVKQYRIKNIDKEQAQLQELNLSIAERIDNANVNGIDEAGADLLRQDVLSVILANNEFNDFIDEVKGDSGDLALAAENFNKNYSLLGKLGVGFESLGVNISHGAAQFAAYAASTNMGSLELGGVLAEKVDDAFMPALEATQKKQARFSTGPSLADAYSGDFDDVVDWVANTGTQAIPSLSLAFTGPAAMPLFFMSGYGSTAGELALKEHAAYKRMAQNAKLLEDPSSLSEEQLAAINEQMAEDSATVNIEDWRKVGVSTLAGAAEVTFEVAGTLAILKGAKKAINPTTLTAAARRFVLDANQEGLSEAGTEIVNNLARIAFLGEDVNWFDGVGEAYAGGALVGGPLSLKGTAPIVYEYAVSSLMDAGTRREINSKLKQLEELTGFKNLDNILDPAAYGPQLSPEVQKLVSEINSEIDLLKDGVAARVGNDLTNSEVREVAGLTLEMKQINDRFRKLAERGVEGAELKAAEKTLRAKFDKLAEQREAILTNNAGTEAAKAYNESLKMSMDAKAGYAAMLMRQGARKVASNVKIFDKLDADAQNDYLVTAKNKLGEGATSEEIRSQAYTDFTVEKNKKQISENKKTAQAFYEANGLDIELVEATGKEYEELAKANNADADSEAHVSADGKTIVVNPDAAALRNRTAVWGHEVLHAIVKNKLGEDAAANTAGENLLNWLETNAPDVHAYVHARLSTSYIDESGKKADAYYEEAMNLLSDYIAEGNAVDISTLGQMRLMVNKIFSKGKSSIELSDAEQTFAFIATYANKNKTEKTQELIRSFARAARDDEKQDKGKMSNSDISNAAERAKQVLAKVSANMDYFDPNSPLIARVLPGMIQAQLAKLSIKGLQFDMEEAVSDIILRLYSGQDIGKFDGRGELYGYINGRIAFRIKDMLKASGEGKNAIVEDFNKSDVEDLKGAAASTTTVEQVEERTEAERPQYKSLLEKNVVEPDVLETIKEKIPRIVGTLKSRMDEQVSKNRTVTPLVNELRLALGKQIDIDLKTAMGGKKDGQLRKWLTARKKVLLENMTTTYLMGAMPIAIQKKVDGVWTSDWEGKKIDRETTSTDNAGRTSGAEMVRRLPQASLKIDDKTFLSYILEESGNPIRGKKESWAKAIAEELAIEIVNEEMKNPDSKIRQAFEMNQERLGVEIADNFVQKLALDLERGNVKHSISLDVLQNPKFHKQLGKLTSYIIKPKIGWEKILSEDGNLLVDSIEGVEMSFKPELEEALKIMRDEDLLSDGKGQGFIIAIKNNKNIPAGVSNALDALHFNKPQATKEEVYEAAKPVGEKIIPLFSSKMAKVLGPAFFGIGGKHLSTKDFRENIDNAKGDDSDAPRALDLRQTHKYIKKKKEGTRKRTGLFGEVNDILNMDLPAAEKIKIFEGSGLHEKIIAANKHNRLLAKYAAKKIIKNARERAYSDWLEGGDQTSLTVLRMLQAQTNLGGGFRAYASFEYVTFKDGPQIGIKLEHVYDNASIMAALASLMFEDISDADLDHRIDEIFRDNNIWAENEKTLGYIDAMGRNNPKRDGRLLALPQELLDNTYNISAKKLVKAEVIVRRKIEAGKASKSLDIDQNAIANNIKALKPSAKMSNSIPQAIFMVGGPGAGKSSIVKGLDLINKGYRLINQDPYLEKYIAEAGLPTDEKTYDKEQRSIRAKLGHRARKEAQADMENATASRESMIVDGTGASYNATTKKMQAIKDAGFEVHMIYVNTSKNVAVERNRARAERSLADFIVTKTWDSVQESAAKYRSDYGTRFYEINTDNLQFGEALPTDFVDAVNNGLNESKAKMSSSLDLGFNEMIERNKGVSSTKVYSSVQAKMLGEKKGKYRIFVPSSAEDFRGLTSYTFAGKGVQGEADQRFFEENLINPYVRGVAQIDAVKQQVRREYHAVAKAHRKHFKMLGKKIGNSNFTYDQALRVYMWTQQGIEVPGMDRDDISFLVNEIMQYPGLIELGNSMQAISRQDTWIDPSPHWMSHTLVSELNSMTEKVGRKKYLQEFIENAEIIFSKENLNKIEAVYGTRHREAIEDALYSMINGRNRPSGMNKQMNQWLNWVNNSTGAIMFFNIRSAVLQTLSATNFINWSDNNPIKAAAAFANQPQFWKDFAYIFNSDKLKQRRSGLQTDVNEAEIANMADGAQNKASAVIAYLLKIGFTPTQIADSFAIAMGGASFYRNRVNTYLKDGLSQKDAEARAWEDFGKTADEAQQSSDPYLVSQEQRSPLGRLVLAFQNTPMQYTRLMKKSLQDIVNGRGDFKTHLSKIIYYGAVQNLVFSALQSALFAMIPGFDDDDESELTDKELEKRARQDSAKYLRIINSMTDSILKGSGVRGAALATIKNTITEYFKQEEKGFTADHTYTILQALSLSPPIGSKARKIYSAIQTKKFEKDVLEARGFKVMEDGRVNLSPAYSIIGSLASGVANVPLDRMVDIVTSYAEALDDRNTKWQRIALALGWKTWDVNAKNEEHDLIKVEAKAKRKEEGKIKAKETRERKKAEEKARFDALTPAEKLLEKQRKAAERRAKKKNK